MGLLLPLASQIVYQVGCKLGRGPDPGGCRGAAVQSWPFWSGVSGVCWAPRLPDSARFSGISLWTKLLTYIIVKQGVYWTGKPRMLDFAIPWSWKCWVNEMFFLKICNEILELEYHSSLISCGMFWSSDLKCLRSSGRGRYWLRFSLGRSWNWKVHLPGWLIWSVGWT